MKVTTLPAEAPTVRIVAIVEFDPWPFMDDNVNCHTAHVGTIDRGTKIVSWATHRTFAVLARNTWTRIVQFEGGRIAVGYIDQILRVGDVLEVR